jgi:Glyoxalase-like domain
VPVRFQSVIDCAGPDGLARFVTRRKRVDAEASRLAGLGATITGALPEEGLDHYAVGMKDPEGNEFDIN